MSNTPTTSLLSLLIALLLLALPAGGGPVIVKIGSGGGGGGAFTFVASATGSDDANDTNVSTSSTLNVATGDLLIAYVTWEDGTTTVSSLTDGGSNTFTFDTGDDVNDGPANVNVHPLYKLSATANATATFTATIGASRSFKRIVVFQYRPAGGETVTKDISGTREASGTSTAMATGTFSTTGTDNVVCGGGAYYTTWTPSSPLVAGSAASQTAQISGAYGWCRIVTTALTTQTASVTSDQNREWAATAIAFKSQ